MNHSILLRKLDHYFIRGTPHEWFVSYLSNRKQYASVTGHVSNELVMTHGVSQGSDLRPLLFLLFINDLPSVSQFLTFYLFGDDKKFTMNHLIYEIYRLAPSPIRDVDWPPDGSHDTHL